jgi:cytochrome c biogenesis protein CcmG, thiol:disulfide interchange protein DsbE
LKFDKRFVAVIATAALLAILSAVRLRPPGPAVEPAASRRNMPEFTFPSLAGERWSLADHRGRIVLVNFWATWCAPCREETPDLVDLYGRYRNRGVEFAGITTDDNPASVVPKFLDEFRVTWPILIPPAESALAQAIEVLPTTFLVDAQGRIARTWAGIADGDDIARALDALLSEQPR